MYVWENMLDQKLAKAIPITALQSVPEKASKKAYFGLLLNQLSSYLITLRR